MLRLIRGLLVKRIRLGSKTRLLVFVAQETSWNLNLQITV
jgi:hypothetical protein